MRWINDWTGSEQFMEKIVQKIFILKKKNKKKLLSLKEKSSRMLKTQFSQDASASINNSDATTSWDDQ